MGTNFKQKVDYDVGVIVGRFQTNNLTDAHLHILEQLKNNHERMVIFIGITDGTIGTKKNPLGYHERFQMLKHYYEDALIAPLQDHMSDEEWSKELDKQIRKLIPKGSVIIYGGRDSFIEHYSGNFDTYEIQPISNISATHVRSEISKKPLNSPDFRSGIIYSCQQRYPQVFPTVDIAIYRKDGKDIEVLMGDRGGWRFFGGFVDVSDNSLEEAAIREGHEEVDVEFDHNLEYVCSMHIEDHRYSRPDEIIMTTLFCAQYIYGGATPKEEFEHIEWIPLKWESFHKLYNRHKILFEALLKKFKVKKPKDEDDYEEEIEF